MGKIEIKIPDGIKIDLSTVEMDKFIESRILEEDLLFVNFVEKYIIVKPAKRGKNIVVDPRNGYLCKTCFCRKNSYSEKALQIAVNEHRCPEWEVAQNGHKPVCGACGAEGTVYG